MTPEQLRRLTNLVDELEMDGYQASDAELLQRRDDEVVAAVDLSLPEDDDATSAPPGAAASGMSASPGWVPASDDEDAATEDVDGSPEEDNADDQETQAEDPNGDETVELTDAEQEVVDVLKHEGELPHSQIKSLTERGSYSGKILQRLREKGMLEHRKDPEDGRRYLYSLAGDDIVDEETGGASHQSPDTSDIGTGGLTPAVRPLDDEEWASVSELRQRDQEEADMIQTSGFAADDGEIGRAHV